MRFLYTFGIRVYIVIIRLVAPFNQQAKKWITGRRSQLLPKTESSDKWIWIHAASLGEFEQGRPVIEDIKRKYPAYKIVLTFFSPSGYEIRKNYPLADSILYLPTDLPANARKFINHFKPRFVIFIKYEYWYNFINQLFKSKIPYYFISAIYRPSQPFFKFYGNWFRKHLANANRIFCQDKESELLLNSYAISNVTVSGDTRFDRVYDVTSNPEKIEKIDQFAKNKKIIVCGSTWPADEVILYKFLNQFHSEVKLIIAPHLVDKEHIDEICAHFGNYNPQLFSEINTMDLSNSKVLIIDQIGLLVHLYNHAHFAYIGGGFGAGIHNILEAAAYSKPVIFGPNYHKFREAKELIALGAGFPISDETDLIAVGKSLIYNEQKYNEISVIAGEYVRSKVGASKQIMEFLPL